MTLESVHQHCGLLEIFCIIYFSQKSSRVFLCDQRGGAGCNTCIMQNDACAIIRCGSFFTSAIRYQDACVSVVSSYL